MIMNKTKNILILTVFCAVIFGFAAAHLLLPDGDVSYSERRKLEQVPGITAETLISGEYMEAVESYLLDQFPLRDTLRRVKAYTLFYAFGQSDNNGLWLSDGHVFKDEGETNEKQVGYGAQLIASVCERYLAGLDVYYSIIPDKTYYAVGAGHPVPDYDRLLEIMQSGVGDIEYIDIFDCLELSDYYRTDSHWRQERIFDVAEKLASSMGSSDRLTPGSEYTAVTLSPFFGVYLGQSALPAEPDELIYLESEHTKTSVVTGAEFDGEKPVYTTGLFEGMDGYDVFLNGAQAILTVECPDAETEKELIIFRDSFGSSLAPLFTGAYSKITLVDLRYASSSIIGDYVDFSADADVLFLLSTGLLNSSMLMR